jgi:hypothetical protein
VVEAIGFHHHLSDYPADSFSPALAVHAANALYYSQFGETGAHNGQERIGLPASLDEGYVNRLGLAGRVESWRQMCAEVLQE